MLKEVQKLIEAGEEYIRAMTAIRKMVGEGDRTGRVMAQFTLENIEFLLGTVEVLDREQPRSSLLRQLAEAAVVEHHDALDFYHELVAALLPEPPELPQEFPPPERTEPWHG